MDTREPEDQPSQAITLEEQLIAVAEEHGPEKYFSATDVAQAFRPARPGEVSGEERWRSYVRQVRPTAIGLARKGVLEILRKGKPVDPDQPFRGVYKLRLKAGPDQ